MKCPTCGQEREPEPDPYPATRETQAKYWWNALAKKYNLRPIKSLSMARRKHLAQRLVDTGGLFWTDVERAVAKRGAWAREKKVPTFDQAVRPSFLTKLLEGNYDGEPTEERQELIKSIVARGRIGKTQATREGLEGGAGCEKWEEISTRRLRAIIGENN